MLKQITLAMILSVSLSAFASISSYGGGDGSSESPFEIWTAEQLNSIGLNPDDWDQHFKLMDNIDMSGYSGTQFNIIGSSCQNLFSGTFDGNEKAISNLSYTAPADNKVAGMFGCLKEATIKNLKLDKVSILSEGLYSSTGGLAGSNEYSTIINCHVSGSVVGINHVGGLVGSNSSGVLIGCSATGSVGGTGYLGGLIGINSGNSPITSCSASCTADGTDNYVGGLIGWNFSEQAITDCFATGSVHADGYFAGGLIGSNESSEIISCYAAGTVSGFGNVGGLVGENYNTPLNACYAAGSVDGTDFVGGLVGTALSGEVNACFWDIQTSGQTDGVGNLDPDPSGVMGKSTAQMKMLPTFTAAGWDFVEVWGIGNGQTYPYLKAPAGFKPADANYSGSVDLQDLAILAADWLE
ncbi:MAG: GLUG motif-containing protein [Anaerohalosphaeraceae bacterium]